MSDHPKKILILGGTKEAAELAEELVKKNHQVTTSLAGRTKEPLLLSGETRIGGFGGAVGLANYLVEEQFDRFIDATHPFAKQISKNALEASKLSGISLEIKTRQPWVIQEGDNWIEVEDLHAATKAIPANSRILLALGSQHIGIFKFRTDVFYLVRMVDQPREPLPLPYHQLLLGIPSPDWQVERELLKEHKITHIVCRNSGGIGAYAKIQAARNLSLPVIMIARG